MLLVGLVAAQPALGGDLRRIPGMYRYLADAGLFTACESGASYPVAHEGDNAALESAYLKSRREPAEPLLVSVDGEIAPRPKMEGDGDELTLIVASFVRIRSDQSCEQRSTAQLSNTYWKLVTVHGLRGIVPVGVEEPHMRLIAKRSVVRGSGGCNRFEGRYAVNGPQLSFGSLAVTEMVCLEGMELEQDLLGVLGTTASHRINGELLDLYDRNGRLIAQFESVYF